MSSFRICNSCREFPVDIKDLEYVKREPPTRLSKAPSIPYCSPDSSLIKTMQHVRHQLVASVLTVSSAAGNLSIAFYDIASQIRIANTEAQTLAEHLQIFSHSIEALAKTLRDADNALELDNEGVGYQTVQDAMKLVGKTMAEIGICFAFVTGRKLEALRLRDTVVTIPPMDAASVSLSRAPITVQPEPRSEPSTLKQQEADLKPLTRLSTFAKLRWVFNRSKIQRLSTTLERLNNHFILLSQTMALKIALQTQRQNLALLTSVNQALQSHYDIRSIFWVDTCAVWSESPPTDPYSFIYFYEHDLFTRQSESKYASSTRLSSRILHAPLALVKRIWAALQIYAAWCQKRCQNWWQEWRTQKPLFQSELEHQEYCLRQESERLSSAVSYIYTQRERLLANTLEGVDESGERKSSTENR
ncbi:MAG: hypothetical protein M1836_007526 [Candelina mexicana]|nr:MAG: hypothetical protein M1836_007526 [Candelina mexicana]